MGQGRPSVQTVSHFPLTPNPEHQHCEMEGDHYANRDRILVIMVIRPNMYMPNRFIRKLAFSMNSKTVRSIFRKVGETLLNIRQLMSGSQISSLLNLNQPYSFRFPLRYYFGDIDNSAFINYVSMVLIIATSIFDLEFINHNFCHYALM